MNFERNKFNRSHSESDLFVPQFNNLCLSSRKDFTNGFSSNCYRFFVEEIYSLSAENLAQIRRTRISIDETMPRLPRKKFVPAISSQNEVQEVPMDVDNSYEEKFAEMVKMVTRKEQNVSESDSDEDKYLQPQINRIQARVGHINVDRKKSCAKCWLYMLIPVVLSFFVYYYLNQWNSVNPIEGIRTELTNNVHGQKHLVDLIINKLEQRPSWPDKLQVLSFIGSQGVGKTYVANLIKEQFAPHLVLDIYGPQLHYEIEWKKLADRIDSCCFNLIVVDDLQLADTDELFAFVHSLPKDNDILLITIFNIHYEDDNMNTILNHDNVLKIRLSFESSGVQNFELVIFDDFTEDDIKSWLKQQIDLHNVTSSSRDEIADSILLTHDVKHGLKGIQSKLILELEKYRSRT